MKALYLMTIRISDLPEEVLQYWKSYWGSLTDHYMIDSTDRRREIGEWAEGIID